MTRKILTLLAAALLGVSCAGTGSPVTHAASPLTRTVSPLALQLAGKKCRRHGYKNAKCKRVPTHGHSETIKVPGLPGVTIVIPPQADDVEVLVVPVANPCSKNANAVGVRIIVINATTGKVEQTLNPPLHLSAGKASAFDPQSNSCKAVAKNKNKQPMISQPGIYAVTK